MMPNVMPGVTIGGICTFTAPNSVCTCTILRGADPAGMLESETPFLSVFGRDVAD